MELYLLDAGGAGLLLLPAIAFILIATLVEALTMSIMKYNRFKKAFTDSAIVNLVSLAVGVLLFIYYNDYFNLDDYAGFALMFGITLVVELVLLHLLNSKQPFLKKTGPVGLVMNIASYLVLYLFTFVF